MNDIKTIIEARQIAASMSITEERLSLLTGESLKAILERKGPAEFYIDYVEYVADICHTYGIGIELTSTEPVTAGALEPYADQIDGILSNNKIRIRRAHLPFQEVRIGYANPGLRNSSLRQLKAWIELFQRLGVSVAVIHPIGSMIGGRYGRALELSNRDSALADLKMLKKAAESCGIILAVEILPASRTHTTMGFDDQMETAYSESLAYTTIPEMRFLASEGFQLVLDSLHLRASGHPVREWEEAGLFDDGSTVLAHFSGGTIRHKCIGQEEVDLFKRLPKGISVTLEPFSLADLQASLKKLGLSPQNSH
jgi:sugar phosphate isomerase/epimerase